MHDRRAINPEATYCFTVVTYQCQKRFHDPQDVKLLRNALRTVKRDRSFDNAGFHASVQPTRAIALAYKYHKRDRPSF